jgi:DNA processing protein
VRGLVALVGSRQSSGYGDFVARRIAAGCVERGVAVVSGAAYGIDAAAHRGALGAAGQTAAVLACGVDRTYPRGNEQLIERIAAEGVLVSEIAPGGSPTRWRFVNRNRVIAALAGGTVVVEAAWRSGALITAGEAADLGRPVAAVPGPVTAASSAGCHRLLRSGATCVTDAAEVVELLAPIGSRPASEPRAPEAVHDGLDETEIRVLDALPVRSAVGVDRLIASAGLERSAVQGALGRLELRGLAARSGGGWRRAPRTVGAPP